jgi:hypothetical protein
MNHTVYFRKGIWERFEKEENKSELINSLLSKHYSITTQDYPKVQVRVESPKLESVKPSKDKFAAKDEDWDGPMFRDKKKEKL